MDVVIKVLDKTGQCHLWRLLDFHHNLGDWQPRRTEECRNQGHDRGRGRAVQDCRLSRGLPGTVASRPTSSATGSASPAAGADFANNLQAAVRIGSVPSVVTREGRATKSRAGPEVF